MDRKTITRRMVIAVALIGLPAMIWALLAWEPFNRLVGYFYPEMFYDSLGRFVPYSPTTALAATLVLTVYAAIPSALLLLVIGLVRWVRKTEPEKRSKTVEKVIETTAVGIVTVLSGLATTMIAVVGVVGREVAARAEHNDIPAHGYHPSMSFVAGGIPHNDLGLPIDDDGNPTYDFDDDLKG